ncbi:MAG: Gfo/Idh/MocA family oxidoreductase [Acidimicrobiia bacterium]|nr:Gfo/Idh/MocA family oxidoreductase [Acidimicrobiia bacterium]
MNRRYFLQSSLALAAASRRHTAASDQVNLAFIGVRGQGKGLVNQFAALPEVNIPYLCDVDANVFGPAAKIVEEKKGKKAELIGDLRRALDDKTVDAIVVATPDHWHAPATLFGCAAGKDVYVEKPCSHNLREGRIMVEAARRTQRVVQHGTMYRSYPSYLRAVEHVQSGKIGKALMAKAWDVQLRNDIGRQQDGPVPTGVDYETWTGPALMLPFNANRFHYKWHWNWNYGTGDAGNDGVHQIDIARWALGVEAPLEVSGMGRKLFFQDDQQTPDTMTVTFNYPDKAMIFEMRIWTPYGMEDQENGVAIYGSEGVMHIGRWSTAAGRKYGYRVYDRKHQLVLEDYETQPQNWHARNFVDCIRSRQKPNADIEIGFTSSLHAHLANIVARTGRPLKFDAKTSSIAGDAQANQLLGREYRKHWATPKVS